MRFKSVLWPLMVCIGVFASTGRALAAFVTYDLVSGSLSSVFVGGVNQLATPVALTDAHATIDFTALQMSDLFVEAGTVLSLQSLAPASFLNAAPPFVVGDGPVSMTSSLFGGPILGNIVGSTVNFGAESLEIIMDGQGISGAQTTVKVDFTFKARGTEGATAIPEPGSNLLFPAGLALLGFILRLERREASC